MMCEMALCTVAIRIRQLTIHVEVRLQKIRSTIGSSYHVQ